MQDGVIEIMGQNSYTLIITLEVKFFTKYKRNKYYSKALSKNFKQLEFLNSESDFSINDCEENENTIILSLQGNATNFKEEISPFFFSSKIVRLNKEVLIDQIRIKFV